MNNEVDIQWKGSMILGCPYPKRFCAVCPHEGTTDEIEEWHEKQEKYNTEYSRRGFILEV